MSLIASSGGVNRIPANWYGAAGGVSRKLQSIYGAAQGTNRKLFSAYDCQVHFYIGNWSRSALALNCRNLSVSAGTTVMCEFIFDKPLAYTAGTDFAKFPIAVSGSFSTYFYMQNSGHSQITQKLSRTYENSQDLVFQASQSGSSNIFYFVAKQDSSGADLSFALLLPYAIGGITINSFEVV